MQLCHKRSGGGGGGGGGELRDLFKRGSLNGDKHSEEKALLPSAFSMVCA